MKKIWKKLLPLAIAATVPFSVAGCGGSSDANAVKFWAYGSPEEIVMYRTLVNAFNGGYGAEHGIEVKLVPKPVENYKGTFEMSGNSERGADLGLVIDDDFKGWVFKDYIENVQGYVNEHIDLYNQADFFPSVTNRYRLDVHTNTSNPDDPLYAIPFDTQPTALYYNQTYFKNAGIKVISVDEKDMDAWNAGGVADKLGNTKESLGITINVPKKGYFRSKNPYVPGVRAWSKPSADEVLVFNNRIPMNWDEIEDLSMLFTRSYNSASPSKYGYFTEWWFNYGWSVGGDCLTDLNGEGKWNFSLLDENKNYVVKEGKTYTGLYSDTTYTAGEGLTFYDKMDVSKTDDVQWTQTGGYTLNNAEVAVRQAVIDEAAKADGALQELPSTRDAFLRYLRLGAAKNANVDGMGGLDVSPNPKEVTSGGKGTISWFTTGELAILAQTSAFMADISEVMESEWNIAPLAQYKQYTQPANPQCDTIKVIGTQSGHSNAKTLVVTQGSTKKDAAVQFALWCAGEEAQLLRTSKGFFPLSERYVKNISFDANQNAPQNFMAFGDAIKHQGAGDWWYMPDHLWVEEWCVVLNDKVRNGEMSFAAWYQDAIKATNTSLVEYEKWKRA